MSANEPTEEQKQAANQWLEATDHCPVNAATENALARLLAEREAKLREELEGERSLSEQLFSTNGTLRARVAELEAKQADTQQELQMVLDDWNDMVRAIQAPAHGTAIARAKLLVQREAQHLADIKALRARLYCHEDEVMCSVDENSQPPCECTNCRLRRRTAHYDDAPAFESWCHDVGGGAAADDGAVCKAHDAEGGEG